MSLTDEISAHALVSVVEMPCPDPSCPGPATQISIMEFDLVRRTTLVHRSAPEITTADIDVILPDLMATPVNCRKPAQDVTR